MKCQITIREAFTEKDAAAFWEQLRIYFMRDIFPDPKDEGREYFLSDTEYRAHIQKIHDREQDRCRYLFFHRDGRDIGFAMPVIFTTEDNVLYGKARLPRCRHVQRGKMLLDFRLFRYGCV